MAAISTMIAAAGLALGAVGVGTQMYGASQSAEASSRMAAEQRRQEQLRQQQMTLESMRRKREIIRGAQVASAQAQAAAGAQGGAESSGLVSALSTISGREAGATLATNQNQELGNEMFKSNQNMAGFMASRANADMISGMGAGLGSLGGSLVRNSQQISQIGQYLFTPRPA